MSGWKITVYWIEIQNKGEDEIAESVWGIDDQSVYAKGSECSVKISKISEEFLKSPVDYDFFMCYGDPESGGYERYKLKLTNKDDDGYVKFEIKNSVEEDVEEKKKPSSNKKKKCTKDELVNFLKTL